MLNLIFNFLRFNRLFYPVFLSFYPKEYYDKKKKQNSAAQDIPASIPQLKWLTKIKAAFFQWIFFHRIITDAIHFQGIVALREIVRQNQLIATLFFDYDTLDLLRFLISLQSISICFVRAENRLRKFDFDRIFFIVVSERYDLWCSIIPQPVCDPNLPCIALRSGCFFQEQCVQLPISIICSALKSKTNGLIQPFFPLLPYLSCILWAKYKKFASRSARKCPQPIP